MRKIFFKFLEISILWPFTFYSDPALAYCVAYLKFMSKMAAYLSKITVKTRTSRNFWTKSEILVHCGAHALLLKHDLLV
jgi:hypothetical protein